MALHSAVGKAVSEIRSTVGPSLTFSVDDVIAKVAAAMGHALNEDERDSVKLTLLRHRGINPADLGGRLWRFGVARPPKFSEFRKAGRSRQ